jgi:hypothetical protein
MMKSSFPPKEPLVLYVEISVAKSLSPSNREKSKKSEQELKPICLKGEGQGCMPEVLFQQKWDLW